MPQSTPLDQLGAPSAAGPSAADEERVKRIMAEIGAGSIVQEAPPIVAPMPVISEPPIATSTGQVRMDAATARANVIGGSTPSMADFQAMLAAAPPGMAPFHGPVGMPPGPALPPAPRSPPSDWRSAISAATRGPLAVAIIVFLLNMPVVTSILSRYAAWMYLNSGEISIAGLLVKALLAAALFGAYQAVAGLVDAATTK
jgi:hypothetical protein